MGSSAEEGFWPSDAPPPIIHAALYGIACPRCFHGFGRRFACMALRGSCLTTMKPELPPAAALFAGLALLPYGLRLRFRFERCVPRIRAPVLGARPPGAGSDAAAADVDAGCVDGYAGFRRIFRMGTLRQLGRQRSCRDQGGPPQACRIHIALCRFPEGPAHPEPWPGEHRCADMQFCCPVVPQGVSVIPALLFPALFALLPPVYSTASE